MQYRLLRNNKESGPYTKAQLEEFGLKPYDLLWIEGRGGAWLYASEIDDLKSIAPAVEEQPYDRFYKGKEKQTSATTNNKQNAFAANVNATASNNTATSKSPKPRFRISGDKVVMIDNAALQQPKPLEDVLSSATTATATVAAKPVAKQEIAKHIQSVGMDWEEMYSDWKGEEKEAAEKPVVAKSQTMEEVKQRYEEAKKKQLDEKQTKTASAARQNIMAGVAILVLAIGGYAGYKLNSNGSSNRSTQTAPVEKAEVVQDENKTDQNSGNDGATTDANTNAATQQATGNQPAATNSAVAPQNEIKSSLTATGNVGNANKVQPPAVNVSNTTAASQTAINNKTTTPVNLKENPAIVKNAVTNPIVKNPKKAVQQNPLAQKGKALAASSTQANDAQYDIGRTNASAPPQTSSIATPTVLKQEAPAKKINDYIRVSKLGGSNNSVQNVLLSVKNVTDFPIDLAVVDVQYYGANGRYQKGETMYVRNINAGDNVNIRVPDNPSSHSITYKVSLVSSEQKTLYLVGE